MLYQQQPEKQKEIAIMSIDYSATVTLPAGVYVIDYERWARFDNNETDDLPEDQPKPFVTERMCDGLQAAVAYSTFAGGPGYLTITP